MEIKFDVDSVKSVKNDMENHQNSLINEYFTYEDVEESKYYSWNDYRFDKKKHMLMVCLSK